MAALLLAAACGRRAAPPKTADARVQTFEGLTLSQSADGRPKWTLSSPSAVLHEDAKTADLDAPVMEFFRDGKPSSRVTALTGTIQTDTHDVTLSSSVVLDSSEDHSRLTTDVLYYSSKRERFHTESPVVIRRPEGVVHGEGMEATPDLSEIRIFRQQSRLSGKAR
ncbi:MAG: LPS export ABC transporter periplasmic protein LptC [Elusimicrobia bacterium]|nr:LPS export ABC transporter periplasmic protein LptC [Elusimicrobiota bacterium]